MPNETTDWPAAWAALAVMDGDEWDAEIDRLNALWKAEYVNAFVAFAVSRKWVYGNAETWASEIADEALDDARGSDPAGAAHADVIVCELETENAGESP